VDYAGRTDAGVHAKRQVLSTSLPRSIPLDGMKRGMNSLLPEDIRVLDISEVPATFHARFSAKARRYRYYFSLAPVPLEFLSFVYYCPYPVKLDTLSTALGVFEGRHDFTAFACTGSEQKSSVKTVEYCRFGSLDLSSISQDDSARIHYIEIQADGFLYKMVRNIVGASLDFIAGRLKIDQLKAMVQAPNTRYNYTTVPGHGLCLEHVLYEMED